jgi:succinate-acetate transporter protein
MEERSRQNSLEKQDVIFDNKESEIERLKNSLRKESNPYIKKDKQIDYLFNKLKNSLIIVNRLDYYGNSIPLGALCYGISFIIYGFYESTIYSTPDKFTYLVLLFFGGLGQLTAGIFEYIKSRTFPTILYLLYGFYFVSFFLLHFNYSKDNNGISYVDCKKIFFGTWTGLSLPLLIGSLKTNIIYLVQNISVFGFFIVKCIGECKDIKILEGKVAGILELITGFFSIYLCFSQIINQHFKKIILPTIKLKLENEIDILEKK